MNIAICGANSSVGQNLLAQVLADEALTAVAMVRSQTAIDALPVSERIQPLRVDYEDAAGLARGFAGADAVVHLAGVLFESRGSSYARANVASTAAVVAAAAMAGVRQIVFISALGAAPDSSNAYLCSKGEAEALLMSSGLPGTILRTPMLLGPGSAAATALLRSAAGEQTWVLGGGRQQLRPLDLDDLSRAIIAALRLAPKQVVVHELVGPVSISQAELICLLGRLQGRSVRVRSIPIGLVKPLLALWYALRGSGPSPAVIEVITAEERVMHNADSALGIALTPLETTLGKLIGKPP